MTILGGGSVGERERKGKEGGRAMTEEGGNEGVRESERVRERREGGSGGAREEGRERGRGEKGKGGEGKGGERRTSEVG